MKKINTNSAGETHEFGTTLAKSIVKSKRVHHAATIITLKGNLGAGKTTFTQGFAKGLGIKRRLISPTFIIIRRYAIPLTKKIDGAQFKNLYHVDAYRLKNPDGLEVLGLASIFADPTAIVLIEWPENIKKMLPRTVASVAFEYGEKENERKIIMSG